MSFRIRGLFLDVKLKSKYMDNSSPAVRSNKQTKIYLQKAFFFVPLRELHLSISFALELPVSFTMHVTQFLLLLIMRNILKIPGTHS